MAKDFLIALDTSIFLVKSKKEDPRKPHVDRLLEMAYMKEHVKLIVPYISLLEYEEVLLRWTKSEYLIRKGYRFGEVVGPEGKELRVKTNIPETVVRDAIEPINELQNDPRVKVLTNNIDLELCRKLVDVGLETRDALIVSQISTSDGCDLFVTTDREILALGSRRDVIRKIGVKIKNFARPVTAVKILANRR